MDENISAHSAQQNTSQSLAVPIAIIAGFGLIAAAIFFSGKDSGTPVAVPIDDAAQEQESSLSLNQINPITGDDHIRGNPNAQIMFVEYSDYDCPFCKVFHETMDTIMDEYGADGRVAWTYRHLPFQQLHPSAPMIAQASECVAKLGGNEAFWTFSDFIFMERERNAQTNLILLPDFVKNSGVDIDDYNACMESGETVAAVEEDYNDAIEMGVRGTPFTVVMVGGQQLPINGAQPYEVVKQIIDEILTQIEGA